MATNNHSLDWNRLYDFVLALGGSGTTIADYLDVSHKLWGYPEHRPWLVAALMRKIGAVEEEPDSACVEFLSGKACEALGLESVKAAPRKDNIGEFLPTIIQCMPEDIWAKPLALWGELLAAIAEEYGIRLPETLEREPEAVDNRTADLAMLFCEAVGSPWTKALNDRLEAWQRDPDYVWLLALRRAKRLDALLEQARATLEQVKFPIDLEERDFFLGEHRIAAETEAAPVAKTYSKGTVVVERNSKKVEVSFQIALRNKTVGSYVITFDNLPEWAIPVSFSFVTPDDKGTLKEYNLPAEFRDNKLYIKVENREQETAFLNRKKTFIGFIIKTT